MKQDHKVFLLLLFVRGFSVYFVHTWFVPDEYWQSLEVAHKLVFNFGYLTWEWMLGIRSYLYPLLIAVLYKIIQFFSLDTPSAIVIGPRILQSILSSYSDLCLYKWSNRSNWALFSIIFSWFWFYVASRTLINTFETCITTIALSLFPWKGKNKGNYTFLFLVAMICVIRPTACIHWFPLCLYHLHLSKESTTSVIWKQYLPVGLTVLLMSVAIDSFMHGSFIVTGFEFLKLNVIKGIGNFYGVHPWYWYLSSGLPSLLGIYILPFIFATLHILKNRYLYPKELVLLSCVVFTIGVYSILPHKEFRFILPLLPIVVYINSNYLSRWSRKRDKLVIWLIAGTMLLSNVLPAIYLSQIHQKGTTEVMGYLREIAKRDPKTANFLFLMPCHSTPFYSHLHLNVTARFLTCQPNYNNLSNYVHESDKFYGDPHDWFRNNYPSKETFPSHIIMFDVLVPFVSDILKRYKLALKIFHAHVPLEGRIGKYVVVYEVIK